MSVMDTALRESLKVLRLSGMLETLDARLAQAHGGELGHLDFLQILCQDEITRRETVAFQRRLHGAKFEQQVALEECEPGVFAHLWVRVVEERLDQQPSLRVVRGAEDVMGVFEELALHRRHGGRERFDEVRGQAVVVERLADRVQGGIADLGHRFVDGQPDQAPDDQAGGVHVERGPRKRSPRESAATSRRFGSRSVSASSAANMSFMPPPRTARPGRRSRSVRRADQGHQVGARDRAPSGPGRTRPA
jgi:hypothetical protein